MDFIDQKHKKSKKICEISNPATGSPTTTVLRLNPSGFSMPRTVNQQNFFQNLETLIKVLLLIYPTPTQKNSRDLTNGRCVLKLVHCSTVM